MAKSKEPGNKQPVPAKATQATVVPAGTPVWEQEMERWFDDVRRHFAAPMRLGDRRWWPFATPVAELGALDVFEKDGSIVVKVDLPGLAKEDIEVSLAGDRLTVRGHKKHEEEVKQEQFYRSERSFGEISRTVQLPTAVDTEHVQANFKDGVLEIRVPKTEDAKRAPRKVPVS